MVFLKCIHVSPKANTTLEKCNMLKGIIKSEYFALLNYAKIKCNIKIHVQHTIKNIKVNQLLYFIWIYILYLYLYGC